MSGHPLGGMRHFAGLKYFLAVVLLSFASIASADGKRDYEAGAAYVRQKLDEARDGQVDQSFLTFLLVQTQVKMQAGEWNTAVHTAEPLVEMQEIVHGPESPELADALGALADVYSNLNRLPEAEPLLKRSVSITRMHKATLPVAHLRALNSLGATYNLLSRFRDAEPPLVEALDLAQQQFGPDAPQVGVTEWLLAASYKGQGKAEQAARAQERAEHLLPKHGTSQ